MKKVIFFILLLVVVVGVYNTSNEEIIIPNESIRLRIIPNSNETKDIYIKNKVKSFLEDSLYETLSDTDSIEESRQIINEELPSISKSIENIFIENDYVKPFKIHFGQNYFPKKTYKNKIYQEGDYESLVVYIGDAKGDNWWCVLFPNYCLYDKSKAKTYKFYIKDKLKELFSN